MKSADGSAPDDHGTDGDDGRSVVFWIVLALVVAVPVLIVLTVIASAVIGAFVLGVSDDGGASQQEPLVTYGADHHENDSVTFWIRGGDEVRGEQLDLIVSGTERTNWDRPTGTLEAGDAITVEDVAFDDVVQIRWTDPESGSTAVIIEWDLRR